MRCPVLAIPFRSSDANSLARIADKFKSIDDHATSFEFSPLAAKKYLQLGYSSDDPKERANFFCLAAKYFQSTAESQLICSLGGRLFLKKSILVFVELSVRTLEKALQEDDSLEIASRLAKSQLLFARLLLNFDEYEEAHVAANKLIELFEKKGLEDPELLKNANLIAINSSLQVNPKNLREASPEIHRLLRDSIEFNPSQEGNLDTFGNQILDTIDEFDNNDKLIREYNTLSENEGYQKAKELALKRIKSIEKHKIDVGFFLGIIFKTHIRKMNNGFKIYCLSSFSDFFKDHDDLENAALCYEKIFRIIKKSKKPSKYIGDSLILNLSQEFLYFLIDHEHELKTENINIDTEYALEVMMNSIENSIKKYIIIKNRIAISEEVRALVPLLVTYSEPEEITVNDHKTIRTFGNLIEIFRAQSHLKRNDLCSQQEKEALAEAFIYEFRERLIRDSTSKKRTFDRNSTHHRLGPSTSVENTKDNKERKKIYDIYSQINRYRRTDTFLGSVNKTKLKTQTPLEKIINKTSSQDIILYFFFTEIECSIFVFTKKLFLYHNLFSEEKTITLKNNLLELSRSILEQNDSFEDFEQRINAAADRSAHFISEELISPLFNKGDSLLLQKNFQNLIIVTEGNLGLMPFHLCKINRSMFLGDRYRVSQNPSGLIWKNLREQSKPGQNISVIQSGADLLFSMKEEEKIISRYKKVNIFPKRVKRSTQLEDSNFIHYIGHYFFNRESPLDSSLQIGDELVTLEGILKRVPLKNCKLFFLNCCEGNLHYPDLTNDEISLPNILLICGVQSVVSNLWPVDDFVAFIFGVKFHEFFIETKCSSPGQALAKAQSWLRGEEDHSPVSGEYLLESIFPELVDSLESSEISRKLKERAEYFRDKSPQTPPFAKPFFWAGYTLSGLSSFE